MLLVGRQEGHPACKKLEWWGAGMVVYLELGADLHMVQLMPLPLTVSCFGKIQIGFTFLVPAHPGSPGKRAVKRVCVCVCVVIAEVVACCSLQAADVNAVYYILTYHSSETLEHRSVLCYVFCNNCRSYHECIFLEIS